MSSSCWLVVDSHDDDSLARLIEAVTELVVKELRAAGERQGEPLGASVVSPPSSNLSPGPRVLLVPGPDSVESWSWQAIAATTLRPSVLVWSGFRQDQLPATASNWPLEARGGGASKVVGEYAAVLLLGSDLAVLGSIANLGAGGAAPPNVALAAVAAGLPVFCESSGFEKIRRHSARLATGFVRAFEESWRTAVSFGIEFGASEAELTSFLARLSRPASAGPATATAKSGGRDVVTTEDVEAVKRAGGGQLWVGHGAIVTPLARQQALDWGIEVKFQ